MTNIHGIYKDGIECCSECNGMLTKINDDFDDRLYCKTCKASTIKVDYSQDSVSTRNRWLAKYPAFAYYSNMPSNMNRVSGYCMGGVTDSLRMPIERNE
jgi:hypothetical protein